MKKDEKKKRKQKIQKEKNKRKKRKGKKNEKGFFVSQKCNNLRKVAAFTDWGPGQPNGGPLQNCACLRRFNGYRFSNSHNCHALRSLGPRMSIEGVQVGRLWLHHRTPGKGLANHLQEAHWHAHHQVAILACF